MDEVLHKNDNPYQSEGFSERIAYLRRRELNQLYQVKRGASIERCPSAKTLLTWVLAQETWQASLTQLLRQRSTPESLVMEMNSGDSIVSKESPKWYIKVPPNLLANTRILTSVPEIQGRSTSKEI